MIFYLSSYKFGDKAHLISKILPKNSKIGYINSSRDWQGANAESKKNPMLEEFAFFDNNGF